MKVGRRIPERGRRRVLVVDDDPLIRDLLRAVFSESEYDVDEAPDGREALRRARSHAPDVVVLDVMMPGDDGYKVCRAMRADSGLSNSMIVLLTARSSKRDREEARSAGANAFFTKPFSPLDLIELIARPAPGATARG